jgi:hypothetical protein
MGEAEPEPGEEPEPEGEPVAETPQEAKRGRGRPKGSKTKRPGSEKAPVPPPAPVVPIDPALVAGALYTTVNLLVTLFPGTPPLTEEEAAGGGKAWAPIFDHYMPRVAGAVTLWGPPLVWAIGVTVPRVQTYLERRAIETEEGKEAGFRPAVGADGRTGVQGVAS